MSRPPLRTYSKRTISRDNGEPAAKKQRTDGSPPKPFRPAASGPAADQQPESSKMNPQPAASQPSTRPKKGSILNYFKVRSPTSGTGSSCEHSSDPVLPPSTPPSSPPRLQSSRKRRRLTTKPVRASCDLLADDSSATELQRSPNRVSAPNHTTSPESSTNTPSTGKREQEIPPDLGKRGTVRKPKSKQATVQTVISLSLNEKGFTECAECNTLYNPLHEKDVKLHARQHAAFLRKAKRFSHVDE